MIAPTNVRPLSDHCLVCGGPLEAVFELPLLPITGIFSSTGPQTDFPAFDQTLMLCRHCGHAQLGRKIDAGWLYGQEYGFRTSSSQTARSGARAIAAFLADLFPGRIFSSIVEFGCNDAYLLHLLQPWAKRLLGVDPIFAGQPDHLPGEGIIGRVGGRIEDVDFSAILGEFPDLVICQHTLEHLEDPGTLLRRLFDNTGEETLFLFEFPCFDLLLEQYRFDQVFHQHLHYFSVASLERLLLECGGMLLAHRFNPGYWGALQVLFRKAGSSKTPFPDIFIGSPPEKSVAGICRRYELFRGQMAHTRQILEAIHPQRLYGYGAALMLPVLLYHLGVDGGIFRAILDDDPQKDGLGYINLSCRIQNPIRMDLSSLSLCLTAMDSRRPILEKLVRLQPGHIINPLNLI